MNICSKRVFLTLTSKGSLSPDDVMIKFIFFIEEEKTTFFFFLLYILSTRNRLFVIAGKCQICVQSDFRFFSFY